MRSPRVLSEAGAELHNQAAEPRHRERQGRHRRLESRVVGWPEPWRVGLAPLRVHQLLPGAVVCNLCRRSKRPRMLRDDSDDTSNAPGDYIFEPNRAKILEELIPKSLAIQLFKAISDSIAGEHGARMTAMHKATDNATDLRDQLKLTYNKARQTAITNEILEIVGGAEALNS